MKTTCKIIFILQTYYKPVLGSSSETCMDSERCDAGKLVAMEILTLTHLVAMEILT